MWILDVYSLFFLSDMVKPIGKGLNPSSLRLEGSDEDFLYSNGSSIEPTGYGDFFTCKSKERLH